MVRTSTRSGGVHRPSPVSLLVSLAIANVKKRFKAQHAKVKRAEKVVKQTELGLRRNERHNEERAKLRRKDAEVAQTLLDMGRCSVRFKLHGACQVVRNDWVPEVNEHDRLESMRRTSWVFCKACDEEGRGAWHKPFRFYSPEELDSGRRHQPYCTHSGGRPGCEHAPSTFRDLGRLLPPATRGPESLCAKLMEKEPRLMFPRLGHNALDVPLVPPTLPPPEPLALPEAPPEPPPTFPKCQRKLAAKPPTTDHVLTSTNVVCKVSERDYHLETPLRRALRQKAHSRKSVLGMNDVIFYKHMRDHNLEPEEAHAEVLKRKRLVHAGCGSTYEPPEMGHLVLGLLNGVPVEDPCPPPPLPNPWQAYLKQRPVAEAGLVAALEAF